MRYPESELVVYKTYEELIRLKSLPCLVPTVMILDEKEILEVILAHMRKHGEEIPPSQVNIPRECYLTDRRTVLLRHRRPYGGQSRHPAIVGINPYIAVHELSHHIQASMLGLEKYEAEYEAELKRVLKLREENQLEFERRYKVDPGEASEWSIGQRVKKVSFELESDKFAKDNWQTFREIASRLS